MPRQPFTYREKEHHPRHHKGAEDDVQYNFCLHGLELVTGEFDVIHGTLLQGSVLEGLYYEGTAELAGDICIAYSERTGVPYILCDTIGQSIEKRLELFGEGIDMFVNVGGATVNNGAALENVATFPSGLVKHMDEIPDSPVRGLCYEYAAKGLPVLSLLYVKGLAEENGISYNPFPMAEPGEGIESKIVFEPLMIVLAAVFTALVLLAGVVDAFIRRRREK